MSYIRNHCCRHLEETFRPEVSPCERLQRLGIISFNAVHEVRVIATDKLIETATKMATLPNKLSNLPKASMEYIVRKHDQGEWATSNYEEEWKLKHLRQLAPNGAIEGTLTEYSGSPAIGLKLKLKVDVKWAAQKGVTLAANDAVAWVKAHPIKSIAAVAFAFWAPATAAIVGVGYGVCRLTDIV